MPKTDHAPARSLASLPCTAFEGPRRIAAGELGEVALKVKQVLARGARAPVLIFDNATSELVEVDSRGSGRQMCSRAWKSSRRWRGRSRRFGSFGMARAWTTARGPRPPKLGVQAREVTLLPRHWEWLGHQPGGASGQRYVGW